jgi:hypothetical protein
MQWPSRGAGGAREMLLPPPRQLPHAEAWPVIEPPFRNHRPPSTQEIEEWEAFRSSPLEENAGLLTDDFAARIRETALYHEAVRRMLDGKRHVSIGASLRQDKAEGGTPVALFVIYVYDDDDTIEVLLDGSSLELIKVAAAKYQPAPVQEEIDRAIRLARLHENLANRVDDGLEGSAILITRADPRDSLAGHRLLDVRFGCPDERLPRYAALVDLSTETVIRAGEIGTGCGGTRHE